MRKTERSRFTQLYFTRRKKGAIISKKGGWQLPYFHVIIIIKNNLGVKILPNKAKKLPDIVQQTGDFPHHGLFMIHFNSESLVFTVIYSSINFL